MTDIPMPRLSDSMESGTILTWLKGDGQHVAEGEDLVEIETDKATMTYTSPGAGELSISVSEGETVAVGVPIARLTPTREGPGTPTEPAAEPAAAVGAPAEVARGPADARSAAPQSNGTGADEDRRRATPLARRMARLHGVDLAQLNGSGPRGRVTIADIRAQIGAHASRATAVQQQDARERPDGRTNGGLPRGDAGPGRVDAAADRIEELTRLQKTVARRMALAKATVPEFQVQTEVEIGRGLALRAELRALDGAMAPSINDLIVKACAIALTEHPKVNASYRDEHFEFHANVNVGIAVAADDALVVATINDADTLSLRSIAMQSRRLADRVRSGEITPPELSGATFTVSNLGMYGMSAITPVINPPQAAILGVGAVRPVPALEDGRLVERQVMTLTLTCDHRILYGADAARFLARVRSLLEQPLMLAL